MENSDMGNFLCDAYIKVGDKKSGTKYVKKIKR